MKNTFKKIFLFLLLFGGVFIFMQCKKADLESKEFQEKTSIEQKLDMLVNSRSWGNWGDSIYFWCPVDSLCRPCDSIVAFDNCESVLGTKVHPCCECETGPYTYQLKTNNDTFALLKWADSVMINPIKCATIAREIHPCWVDFVYDISSNNGSCFRGNMKIWIPDGVSYQDALDMTELLYNLCEDCQEDFPPANVPDCFNVDCNNKK
jgi:hypothetical protein